MNVFYHYSKANVVEDALIRTTIGILPHLDEAKKDLARKLHRLARLGVRFSGPGVIVHHNSESSLVVEVKSKQHLD